MANRFRDDIRKIAQTDELLRRIKDPKEKLDKASIAVQRGVGISAAPFDPCQTLYSTDDGVYTMKGLIDGTEGPQLVDGEYNKCQLVNKITEMYDIDDNALKCTLKPDGVFDPEDSSYWYTSSLILYNIYPADTTEPLFYATITELQDRIQQYTIDTTPTYVFGEWADPTYLTVTTADIAGHNWTVDYPFGLINEVRGSEVGVWDNFWAYPRNYDSTIDSFSSGNTPQIYDATSYSTAIHAGDPVIEVLPGFSMYPIDGVEVGIASLPKIDRDAGFQLAWMREDALWEPNPDSTIAPIKYTNGVSTVRIGFGTSRYATVTPAKDGGFAVYETNVSYVPTGLARVYRGDRTLAAVIPVAQLAAYLPQV